jgi:hypothetical protein
MRLSVESRMKSTQATVFDRKSGVAEGPAVRPGSRTKVYFKFPHRLFRVGLKFSGRPGLSGGFSNPRERFISKRPGRLAAASPGGNGPELSNQPLRLFLATALMLCIMARL